MDEKLERSAVERCSVNRKKGTLFFLRAQFGTAFRPSLENKELLGIRGKLTIEQGRCELFPSIVQCERWRRGYAAGEEKKTAVKTHAHTHINMHHMPTQSITD